MDWLYQRVMFFWLEQYLITFKFEIFLVQYAIANLTQLLTFYMAFHLDHCVCMFLASSLMEFDLETPDQKPGLYMNHKQNLVIIYIQ